MSVRRFTKTDWYGFAGASRFKDGSEPLIGDIQLRRPGKLRRKIERNGHPMLLPETPDYVADAVMIGNGDWVLEICLWEECSVIHPDGTLEEARLCPSWTLDLSQAAGAVERADLMEALMIGLQHMQPLDQSQLRLYFKEVSY